MTLNSISNILMILCLAFVQGLVTSLSAAEELPILDKRQGAAFAQSCGRCHVRPGIGVPILGDADEWELRRRKGFEALVANTVTGIGEMPPLGTCGSCSEDDFRRLVAFIAGSSFKLDAETRRERRSNP